MAKAHGVRIVGRSRRLKERVESFVLSLDTMDWLVVAAILFLIVVIFATPRLFPPEAL